MPELSDLIYHYSVKIAELESRLPKLSQVQLDKIINEEFQFSSDELAIIHQESEHLLEAGYNFLREDNYDRAAEYFNEAIKLQPLNMNVLKGLSASNLALFVKTGDLVYKTKLEENCEKMISIEPSHSEAAKAITAVEKYNKTEKSLMIKGSVVGFSILFLGIAAIFSESTWYFLAPALPLAYFGGTFIMNFINLRKSTFEGIEIQ